MKLSLNATTVLEKRYLKKDDSGRAAESPEAMFRRVAQSVVEAEKLYGTPEDEIGAVMERFYRCMTALEFLPNSPTLMNAGRELGQLSACFVLPVEDSMEAIFETVKNTALIHKSGGGTGFAFSRLRPEGDCVQSTKGVSSGPISFMEVFNAATETIKQGGTRRGANMGILRVDHPDILAFIACKSAGNRLTNFNLSVGVTEAFMRAVENDEEYDLVNPRTREAESRLRAREVFDRIVHHAWQNGEPGIIFLDRLNRDNPTPEVGEIESTNPCVSGDALVSTELGLLRLDELVQSYGGGGIGVVVDGRTPRLQRAQAAAALQGGSPTGEGTTAVTTSTFTRARAIQCLPIAEALETGKRETVRVVTRSGYEVVVTPDHRILTTVGWMEAGRLRPSRDRVLLQGGRGLFNQNRRLPMALPELVRDRFGRVQPNMLPTQWSEELGMAVGWLVARGSLRAISPDCSVVFPFGGEDVEMLTYLRPHLNRWYGREAPLMERRGKGCNLTYRSKLFADFFLNLGVEPVRLEVRRAPRAIFTATRETVVGFLRALFTSCGTVSYAEGRTCIRLAPRSEQLLKDVQLLLLNLGIKSKLRDRQREARKLFVYAPSPLRDAREMHRDNGAEERIELEVSRDHTTRFFDRVGFVSSRYKLRTGMPRAGHSVPTSFDDEVTKVEPAGLQVVYDLVEPASHSFVANGIVVHNCGEQPLLPYESCNLGSINLPLMLRTEDISAGDSATDGASAAPGDSPERERPSRGAREVIDWAKLEEVVRVAVRFLDDVIDVNRYPLPAIEEMTTGNRKIGLGVMGFADMLIRMGISYDSAEAIEVARYVMRFIKEKAYAASAELAEQRGNFPNYGLSRFRRNGTPNRRNATLTTIAPTGTISIIAGSSSGIEPLFALSYVRNVLDNQQLVEVNELFEKVARERGFYSEELMREIARRGSARGLETVPEDVQRIFVTAHDISPEWHIRMQAAFQEHVDNAVSKTVNFPHTATEQDVADVYMLASQLGCKGVTVYRDGSRDAQVLSTGKTSEGRGVLDHAPTELELRHQITPRPRPEVTLGRTEKIQTGCGHLYITINEDENGLCEVFTQMGKSGGCTASQAEATSRMVSLALRTGVDPESIIRQLKGIRCPAPSWQNGSIVLSCPDAIAKAIEHYLNKDKPMLPGFDQVPMADKKTPALDSGRGGTVHDLAGMCPQCPDCGNMLEAIEGCIVCRACGYSQCY